MGCSEIVEGHSGRAVKIEVGGHGAEADICVVGCSEVRVRGEAIGFGDSGGDTGVYRDLSLLVVFFCFFDLEFERCLPFLLGFLGVLLLCSLASFFVLISVRFCLALFFQCVELVTW